MSTRKIASLFVRGQFALSATTLAACAGLSIPAGSALAQQQGSPAWTGNMGITESVAQIMARAPIVVQKGIIEADERAEPDRFNLPSDPNSPAVPRWPYVPDPGRSGALARTPNYPVLNPPIPTGGSTDSPQTLGLNTTTVQISDTVGYIPPDSQGSIGPNQIVIVANGRIRTYAKISGTPDSALNTTVDSFFTTVRNGSSMSDQQVRFDKTSQRWFVLGINTVGASNRVCIAVSSGSQITSTSSFTFFFFQQDSVAPAGDTGRFADYPSLGVDANALYTGCNMFASSFIGTSAWVVQKASILGAGPIAATAFRSISTGNGPYSPRGVDNDDPAATEGYFIGTANGLTGRLVMRRINNPGGAPSISGNLNITVPSTAAPGQGSPAAGSNAIDALDDRLFAAQIHLDRSTGLRTLVTAHDIRVTATGVGSTGGNRTASRWYQIGSLTTTPTLIQSGTLFDSAASNPVFYTIPSIAISGQGHMALGCTQSSTLIPAGDATAGRLNTDALGTLQSPLQIIAGVPGYNIGTRWGDYSATIVDPVDDQTIWTVQEFCNSTNSWALRLTKLLAPLPVAPTGVDVSVTQGDSNVNVVVTGVSTNGSQDYDTEPGYNRIHAAINGGGVTVNSTTWNSTTQVTLNISVDLTATATPRTITITNPDGQSATSATALLTINAANPVCPSFTLQPAGSTYCDGDTVTLTAAADGNPPPTLQWKKDNIDIPGETNPTLTILTAHPTDSGTYSVVATNSCGSLPSNDAVVNVELTAISQQPQSISVPAGSPASFTVVASDPTGYEWFKDNNPLPNSNTPTYTINAVTPGDAGVYTVSVSGDCGGQTSDGATLTVTGSTCYANCDASTAVPFLNVADFTCFLQKFAAGDVYANCDQSNQPPILNVADFTCFLQKFAAGCSAP